MARVTAEEMKALALVGLPPPDRMPDKYHICTENCKRRSIPGNPMATYCIKSMRVHFCGPGKCDRVKVAGDRLRVCVLTGNSGAYEPFDEQAYRQRLSGWVSGGLFSQKEEDVDESGDFAEEMQEKEDEEDNEQVQQEEDEEETGKTRETDFVSVRSSATKTISHVIKSMLPDIDDRSEMILSKAISTHYNKFRPIYNKRKKLIEKIAPRRGRRKKEAKIPSVKVYTAACLSILSTGIFENNGHKVVFPKLKCVQGMHAAASRRPKGAIVSADSSRSARGVIENTINPTDQKYADVNLYFPPVDLPTVD